MTCRWLQSEGRPCCLGLAARPVRIHPTATSVKSPAQYPSDRAPIPLIVVLTPCLAQSRLARSKGSAGSTAKLSRRCNPSCVVRERHAQGCSGYRRQPSPRNSSEPAEIGRKSPPVGWFGPNFTLSCREQANGNCDVPNLNSAASILLGTTYNSRNPANCDIIKGRLQHRMLGGLGQKIGRIRNHRNYGSGCAHQ